jgi:hypothetical protein
MLERPAVVAGLALAQRSTEPIPARRASARRKSRPRSEGVRLSAAFLRQRTSDRHRVSPTRTALTQLERRSTARTSNAGARVLKPRDAAGTGAHASVAAFVRFELPQVGRAGHSMTRDIPHSAECGIPIPDRRRGRWERRGVSRAHTLQSVRLLGLDLARVRLRASPSAPFAKCANRGVRSGDLTNRGGKGPAPAGRNRPGTAARAGRGSEREPRWGTRSDIQPDAETSLMRALLSRFNPCPDRPAQAAG